MRGSEYSRRIYWLMCWATCSEGTCASASLANRNPFQPNSSWSFLWHLFHLQTPPPILLLWPWGFWKHLLKNFSDIPALFSVMFSSVVSTNSPNNYFSWKSFIFPISSVVLLNIFYLLQKIIFSERWTKFQRYGKQFRLRR